MKKLLVVALLLSASFCIAQKKINPVAYAHSITATDLKKQLHIIAGAKMEGRETATEGQRKAADYIENEFRRLGLQPGNGDSYQQYFDVYWNDDPDQLTGATLLVNGKSFILDQDFHINPTYSFPGKQELKEVIIAGSRFPDSSLFQLDVRNKWVVMLSSNVSQIARLRARGAAGFFIITNNFPSRKSTKLTSGQSTKTLLRSQDSQQMLISEKVAQALLKESWDSVRTGLISLSSYHTDIELNIEKNTKVLKSSNVIGVLPGTTLNDEYVLITAHYDHEGKREDTIFYGADDNGSGTVSVIELAEAFAKAKSEGNGPQRSIVFLLLSGEEKGLWGSAYYANNPIYPLDKTSAVLNMDMIGRTDSKRKKTPDYIYIIGDDKLSSDLRPISESVNKQYTSLYLDYKYNDPKDHYKLYYRSDHYNFAKYGVPSIFYFSGLHADYHQPTDTPEKINYPLLSKRAQLVFYTAWAIADHNALLKRDLPLQEVNAKNVSF
jgi:hypothetical protein